MQTNRLGLHMLRGLTILGSSLFFIPACDSADRGASATGFVAPLFVTALSIIFLSEKVGPAAGSRRRRPDRRAHHLASGHRRVSPRSILSAGVGAGLGLHADHHADDERHRARHHREAYSSIVGVCILSAMCRSLGAELARHRLGIFSA